MKKRLFTILLSVSIILTFFTATAYAQDGADGSDSIESAEDDPFSELSDEELARISWPDYLRRHPNQDIHVKEDDPDSYTQNENLKCYFYDTDYFDYAADSSFESRYDSREHGRVTSVKNQGRYGTCWAFATIAAMESALISNKVTNNSIDLSEAHLIYQTYLRKYSGSTFYAFLMYGNNFEYWGNNPVYESKAPYSGIQSGSENSYSLPDEVLKNPDFEGTNAYEVSYKNPDQVKALIKQFGGVFTPFYSYQGDGTIGYSNYNNRNEDLVFYVPDDGSTKYAVNHGVEVIGWDDNFDKKKFGTTPPGNGAWLCKNSYGTNGSSSKGTGSGFFWISYYDASIKTTCAKVVDVHELGYLPTDLTVNQTEFYTRVGKPITLEVNRVGGQHATLLINGNDPKRKSPKTISFDGYNMDCEKISDTEYKITPKKGGTFTIPIRLYLPSIYDDDTSTRYIKSINVQIHVADPTIKLDGVTNSSRLNNRYHVTEGGKITVSTKDISNPVFTYKSDDESIITVDQEGNFTPVSYGEANITVTCMEDDYTGSITVPMRVGSKGFTVSANNTNDSNMQWETLSVTYTTCSNNETHIEVPVTATTKEGYDVTDKLAVSNGTIEKGVIKLLYNGKDSSVSTKVSWFDGGTNFQVPVVVSVEKINHKPYSDTITKSHNGSEGITKKNCSVCGEEAGYLSILPVDYYINENQNISVYGNMVEYNHLNNITGVDTISLTEGRDYTVNTDNGYYRIIFTSECKYYSGMVDTGLVVPTTGQPDNTPDVTEYTQNTDTPVDPPANAATDDASNSNNEPVVTNDPSTGTVAVPTADHTNDQANDQATHIPTAKKTPKVKVKSVKIKSVKSTKKRIVKINLNKKTAGIDGYAVQVSTKKNFKAGETIRINKPGKTITLKGLKPGIRYYIRVCAFVKNGNEKVYGSFSKAKKVTVKK
ncbi:MAG: hypothetical protein IK078_08920 [Lachnospiraceae bacterium]|nr:hypothetical protein [Lachnospiraceae bacterium]